jgi:hypothetical protein
MDASDRRLRALLILVGAAVLCVGMWLGVVRYYRVDTAARSAQAQYAREAERIRAAQEFAGGGEPATSIAAYPGAPRELPEFSGSLTETQSRTLIESLSQHRGQAVVVRPAGAGSEGSAVSPAASRAAAQQFAQVFWKSGWDARLVEPGPDRKWRPSGLAVVANPDPPGGRSQLAANAFVAALEKAGIRARRSSSYKVDRDAFELYITVEARP